jgi:hypothetical protein
MRRLDLLFAKQNRLRSRRLLLRSAGRASAKLSRATAKDLF